MINPESTESTEPARSFEDLRRHMVDEQIIARGLSDPGTIAAMRTVPRERFVGESLREFAYEDTPLPIEEGQTISQPFIVAVMVGALEIGPEDRVLEIGLGSGYAAAVLGRVAREVYAVERYEVLASLARSRMAELGYENVRVRCGDGTRGWAEHAPYDAILVSAGGPDVPRDLLAQLAIGGRLVIPVGKDPRTQELLRIRRTAEHAWDQEQLGQVRFVPLIGAQGWAIDGAPTTRQKRRRPFRARPTDDGSLPRAISEVAEPIRSIDEVPLSPLLDRMGDARVVLIGEATHGTSEFYEMRARITRELVQRRGFNIVCIEGDWPDTRAIDQHVRGLGQPFLRTRAFSRFPSWMWRNRETRRFVDWLADFNEDLLLEHRVSVHGLDLYSLNNSIGAVLEYLDRVDPEAAGAARVRYGCFSPWESDPATYGRAAVSGRMPACETEAVAILTRLLERRMQYLVDDGDAFFDASRNAVVIREAERYYRTMYYGSRESWNLRDRHMFDTLRSVLHHRGAESRAVVWAHNSHVGDARATEMGARGELNIGQLAREHFGDDAYLIGFGTHVGTVAAASAWDRPMRVMDVRPSHVESYERQCHEAQVPAFLMPLRESPVRADLLPSRLERAIGVIYRPETEIPSHYFQATLPAQFDEYVWFDRTTAVRPIASEELSGVPETYPFGL